MPSELYSSSFHLTRGLVYYFYSEEAIVEGCLNGVDVSALILSAHVLFKRKEFGKYSNTSVQAASHGECVKNFVM